MRHRIATSALLVLGCAVLAVWAGDSWVDKDWKNWSKDEVNVVLHDSPWSKRWAKGEVNTSAALPGVSGAGQEGAAGEGAPRIDYYFQIRSAEPVRDAVVRQTQFDQSYDTSMSADQKKSFDDRAAQFLNRRYDDSIVVHVVYSSNIQDFERQLAEYWQSLTQDSIKDKVYLITERGDRIPPNHFVSPRTGAYEFELNFPRTVNGEPLIHPTDKEFSIQFTNPPVGNSQNTVSRSPNSGGMAQSGAARQAARGPGAANRISNPLPPTGANSTNPASHTVASFKAERVLVQFDVDRMMWKGKLTY
jgi:hypothetical protein